MGGETRTPVALDGLGGDRGLDVTVPAAVEAVQRWPVRVLLTGPKQRLQDALRTAGYEGDTIEVVDAPEEIGMGEHPVEAVRRKRRSSLVVAAQLVAEGRAAAVVSAGNTGAALAASLFGIGRLPGVERAAIATPFPTRRGVTILLDSGANVDCRPQHLVQFALLGAAYSHAVFGVPEPKVGLLSVGTEPGKGDKLTVETHGLLAQTAGIRFIGNVEGLDIPAGTADVVVCDGFVGNVVLKLAEGLAEELFGALKSELLRGTLTKVGAALARPALRRVAARLDYTEYGGAPLLGLKGLSFIAHGRSNARAIAHALRAAQAAAARNVVQRMAQAVQGEKVESGS